MGEGEGVGVEGVGVEGVGAEGVRGGEREGGGGFVSCYGRSRSASTVTLTGMTDLEDKDFKERDATFRQRTNLQEGGGE